MQCYVVQIGIWLYFKDEEYRGMLQFVLQTFSKCKIYEFTYLINFDVHLLKMQFLNWNI